MQVEVIRSYDAFEALKTDWNDLYRKDPEAQLCLSSKEDALGKDIAEVFLHFRKAICFFLEMISRSHI